MTLEWRGIGINYHASQMNFFLLILLYLAAWHQTFNLICFNAALSPYFPTTSSSPWSSSFIYFRPLNLASDTSVSTLSRSGKPKLNSWPSLSNYQYVVGTPKSVRLLSQLIAILERHSCLLVREQRRKTASPQIVKIYNENVSCIRRDIFLYDFLVRNGATG
jgi:hypothetical protein